MKKEILKILKEEPFLTIYKTANDLKIESYLVGGFVRDIFLNINEKKDIDIMVIGSAMELAKNLKKNLNNSKNIQFFKNFGTAMLEWNKFVIEVVGARKESYNHNSRKPIVKIGTLEDDQNRRDFTINSLAISINKQNFGELIDPFNGVRDLKNTDGISKQRSFVSNVFNNIISFIFKKKLSDPLTGFFAGKTRILNKKFFSLNNSGFKILLDLIYCNKSVNFKITEKIIDFNKRETGSSKLNLQVSFSFLTQILSYLFNGLISSKFIGFIIIGSFGYLIHFLFLYIFMYYLSLSFLSSHLFTTLITASLNFFLNNFLNFHENEIKNLNTFFKSLLKYYLLNIPGIISSLGGASFAYNVLNKNPFLSSFIGAALDTVFKYILSKTWIWKSK